MANRLTKQGTVTYVQAVPPVQGRDAYCVFSGTTKGVFPNFLTSTTASASYGQTVSPLQGSGGFYYSPGASNTVVSADGSVSVGGAPYKLPPEFAP